MVHFIAFLQPTQNTDGILYGRLAHKYLLEAALQGGVFLNVFAVFLQSGGTNKAQFTACKHGLDHVAHVHGGFAGGTRTNNGVQLVNEGDDLPVGRLDFIKNSLEAFLKFTTVFGASNHRPKIQADQGLVLQGFRHVTSHNAAGKPLHNGGFTHTGFADQHRVVFGAAGEYLHHAANFLITPDHRIDFAFAGELGQVGGVLLQGLELPFRVLGGHLGGATHSRERCLNRIVGGTVLFQQLCRVGIAACNACE